MGRRETEVSIRTFKRLSCITAEVLVAHIQSGEKASDLEGSGDYRVTRTSIKTHGERTVRFKQNPDLGGQLIVTLNLVRCSSYLPSGSR